RSKRDWSSDVCSSDLVKTEKTVVTGSLIPTAETVGPAPVEVVGTVEIQKSGQQDILQTLKKLSTSFAGNGNVGQTINNRGQGGRSEERRVGKEGTWKG